MTIARFEGTFVVDGTETVATVVFVATAFEAGESRSAVGQGRTESEVGLKVSAGEGTVEEVGGCLGTGTET